MDQQNQNKNQNQMTSLSEDRFDEMQLDRLDNEQPFLAGISQKYDEEVSAEVSPTPAANMNLKQEEEQGQASNEDSTSGRGWGIVSIILSILSFFMWPYLLAPAGIIIGIIAIRRGSRLGWWATALGIVALILTTLILPFRLIF